MGSSQGQMGHTVSRRYVAGCYACRGATRRGARGWSDLRSRIWVHPPQGATVTGPLGPRGNRNGPLRAGRIEWWGFSEAHSAIYPLISPNLGELGTSPSARDGMRDGPPPHTRHLGPPPPISLKFDREAAYRIRTARNRREPAPAAPLTAPILTRRARFRALAP